MSAAAPDWRIERLAETASTMDEAHARARAGAEEGLWIRADRQTRGRGRRGRSWLSAEGALAASLILRPARRAAGIGAGRVATLSFIAALALHDALRGLGVASPIGLKWPNDVLVSGGKIAGLLLEADGAGAQGWVVLGVGLNLRGAPPATALPEGALAPTALDQHGVQAEADMVLEALSAAFESRYARWIETGFAGQRQEWLARAAGRDGPIQAALGGERIDGRFVDVDDEGALVLETALGRRRVHAAEVFLPGADGGFA